MTKIKLISDVHAEFDNDRGRSFSEKLEANADILVIAGDLIPLKEFQNALNIFERLCPKFSQLIYVLGNHEIYNSSPEEVMEPRPESYVERLKSKFKNLHIATTGSVFSLFGQKFVCSTLWFADGPKNKDYERYMTDFKVIKGFSDWVYKENERSVQFLNDNVDKDSIVVTHHLPSFNAVSERFKGSVLNRYFMCPMDDLIMTKKPKLWAFGHTHDSKDFRIGKTKLICNPRAYPNEKREGEFNPNLIIEV